MRNQNLSVPLTRGETIWGFFYMAFEILLLPTLLALGNLLLPAPLGTMEINLCYFLVNFLAVILIFHRFLGKNLALATHHPAYLCQAVILGLASYFAMDMVVSAVVMTFDPNFSNLNDSTIANISQDNLLLMSLCTVLLVPPAEECLFRGLIFRNLYGKSRWAAYLVSTAAFAAIHLISYLTLYSPMEMALAFLQYVPAGVCLAWAYTKADTICAPILLHGIINAIGMYAMYLEG